MDDIKIGRLIRAIRHRFGWRQRDLGARVGISQQIVSMIERGLLAQVPVAKVRAIAAGAGVRLPFHAEWRGGELDRLLDADHAALQSATKQWLESLGWLVAVEVTYSRYGERGSVDLLAFHPRPGAVLVIEIKTMVADLQSLLRSLDVKTRLGRSLARELEWEAQSVVPCLVLAEGTTNRRRISQHGPLLARFAIRGRRATTWMRGPAGPATGLLAFRKLPDTPGRSGRRAGRQRMRLTSHAASVPDPATTANEIELSA